MTDLHATMRSRNEVLRHGPAPTPEDIAEADAILYPPGPESNPILGGNEIQNPPVTPEIPENNAILGGNEIEGFAEPQLDDALPSQEGGIRGEFAKGLSLLTQDVGAAIQQIRSARVEELKGSGALQPLDYIQALLENPDVDLGDYYDASTNSFFGVPSDDYFLHNGELFPRVMMHPNGEREDLSEHNQLINFGRLLMGGMLDPIEGIATAGRAAAALARSDIVDPSLLGSGITPRGPVRAPSASTPGADDALEQGIFDEFSPPANPLQINDIAPGAVPAPDGAPGNTFLQQELPTFIPGSPGATGVAKVSPEDIGKYWDADYIARYGGPGDPNDPVSYTRAVDIGAAEMDLQLRQIESGEGWYDKDIRATRRAVNEIFPEIKSRPIIDPRFDGNGVGAETLHQLISAIAAPMSFNNRPKPNMNVALKIFDIFLEEGRIPSMNPETGKLWTSRSSGRQGLEVLQHLVDEMGVKKAMKWLFTEHPISELRQFKINSGAFKSDSGSMGIPGIQSDEKLGAYIIGQKGGSFFLNLNGIDDTTSDLWDTRNFNRAFGRMMHSDGSLINQPRSGEREIQKQYNRDIGSQFGKSERDSQAIRWYYEQNLNAAMGQKSAKPSKFSDGAIEFRDITKRRSARNSGADVRSDNADASGSGRSGQPGGSN